MNDDLEHLRLLSIFHYVVAGLVALVACIPFLHLFLGIAFLSGWMSEGHQAANERTMGCFFIGFAAVFILAGWAFAALVALTGRRLAQHTHYTYCLVIAAIACMFMPAGTVLGVFTLIVLLRPSVKVLFGQAPPVAPTV